MLSLAQWEQMVSVSAFSSRPPFHAVLVAPVLLPDGPCASLCHSPPDSMKFKAGTIFLHQHKAWPREAPQYRTVGRDEGMNKGQRKTKQTLHDWRQVRGIVTYMMLAPSTSPERHRALVNIC